MCVCVCVCAGWGRRRHAHCTVREHARACLREHIARGKAARDLPFIVIATLASALTSSLKGLCAPAQVSPSLKSGWMSLPHLWVKPRGVPDAAQQAVPHVVGA